MVKEGIILGHKISKSRIKVDRAKIDVIAKLPYLTNVKGVRSFLGHAGFYQRFIKDFSKIARPMTQLLMKDAKFIFSNECMQAFNILKNKLTFAPVIIAPDWNLNFELMCDASDYDVGAVLGQRIDKKLCPVYYASKTMNDAQEHYTTTDKDLLAVFYAFDKFRSYLIMSKTIVYTDHSALKYLFNKQDAKPRFISWVLLLQEFTIEIKDKKGTKNLAADHLSRLEKPDLETLNEEAIRDSFPDEHLMAVQVREMAEDPWLATPYHPQTSGQTENTNRAIKHILERTVNGNSKEWAYKLDDALWAFRTAYKSPIGSTPLRIVYGKACHHPIEMDHKAYWALKNVNLDLDTIGKYRVKRWHYAKIMDKEFHEGDEVLVFNSRLKHFLGKLKSRWYGPYTISKVFPYGTVEVCGSHYKEVEFEVSSTRFYVVTRLWQQGVYRRQRNKSTRRSLGFDEQGYKRSYIGGKQRLIEVTGYNKFVKLLLLKLVVTIAWARFYCQRMERRRMQISDRLSIAKNMGGRSNLNSGEKDVNREIHDLNFRGSFDFIRLYDEVRTRTWECGIAETPKLKETEQTLEDEFNDLHLNLPVLEILAHSLMYNEIMDKYIECLKLGKNGSAFTRSEILEKMKDPRLFTLPCRLGDSKSFNTLANLGSCVNLIPLYLFKKIKIGLLEETGHVLGLVDGTKSYLVGIVKNVEVYIGKLKLLEDFYVIDMEKDPTTLLLVGRGFLATANVVIDFKKAKIAVGEGVNRCLTPYYAKKDFMDYHLLGDWEMAIDAKLNPFKDVLVFRRMVEFLGAIPINLKGNMWESKELTEKKIDWNRPTKVGDEAWHIRIELIDPDEDRFTRIFQSISTTRKMSEKENPSKIIDLDHFYDSQGV
ncbi:reverse transcriptase domain-containing protein [Tanacetum coccineum]